MPFYDPDPVRLHDLLAGRMIGQVRATAINHVSIPATDVDAVAGFYQDVFGVERIPSPNFGTPVRWLRLGDLQLHIFEVEEERHTYQHFGFEVDDFEAAYLRLRELGIFDQSERFGSLWELPGGEVQMYFRDPADNFVEIDWPDVASLDRSVFGDDLKLLADEFPQGEENLRARLFLRLQVPT